MGLELGMREWMLLAGVALVVVILLDAIRRSIKQGAENERLMRAKRSSRKEPHADFDWLKELPNGGARVIYRAEGDEDSIPSGRELADEALDTETTDIGTSKTIGRSAQSDAGSSIATSKIEESDAPVLDPDPQDAGECASSESAPGLAPTPLNSAPSGQTVDWLETLDTDEDAIEEVQTLIEDTPPEHVLLIHLKADDHKPYEGDTLLQLLLACDLRFGDLGFFHRHEQSGGRGPIQFSVANLLKPGVFDIDSMSSLQTAGVVFFMRVPGPKDLLTAYDAMLETARAVVQHLGGTLLDHSHSVLTKQAIEHDKTLLREYARKQLLQKRS